MSNGLYTSLSGTIHKPHKMYAVLSGVTRSIKKSYGVVNGINKLMFSGGPEVAYTGAHTVSDVDIDGAAYKLYTITASGTLTVVGEGVQYWICGGGAGGVSATHYETETTTKNSRSGPGGSGGYVNSGTLPGGNYTVLIGSGGAKDAPGGKTAIGEYTAGGATLTEDFHSSSKIINGASGGGGGAAFSDSTAGISVYATASAGSGVSTYPFGITALKAHSAGGGGGGYARGNKTYRTGGAGGSNGSDGVTHSAGGSYPTYAIGGAGGEYGGGAGGIGYNANTEKYGTKGGSATFYGSGGGGGGYYYYSSTNVNNHCGTGGAGYQGVAYVLVPVA